MYSYEEELDFWRRCYLDVNNPDRLLAGAVYYSIDKHAYTVEYSQTRAFDLNNIDDSFTLDGFFDD